ALEQLGQYSRNREETKLNRAEKLLEALDYTLERAGEYIFLKELPPGRGWGLYVINLAPENRLLIEVPAPLDEWATGEGGAVLLEKIGARALALAGTRRTTNTNGKADVLSNFRSMFHVFQKVFGKSAVVQLRGATDISESSSLWVRSAIPESLNVAGLRKLAGQFEVKWGTAPGNNLLRESTQAQFVELFLSHENRRILLANAFSPGSRTMQEKERLQSIVGYIQDRLLSEKQWVAPKGSDAYRVPEQEELLFFDENILKPLFALIACCTEGGRVEEKSRAELNTLADFAALFGYHLTLYRHQVTEQEYLILSEFQEGEEKRYWGTYVFRLGENSGHIVQVPRPLFEVNVFEYGTALFENLRAAALLIGGTHPQANRNHSADLIRLNNKASLFNLVHQTLLRTGGDRPMLTVQCRGAGRRALGVDTLISSRDDL
ncbi:MAG: hypothetical protein D3909_16930, partial [Candidatus Electrothrix sp. ATG1]|nr:hypothetical protein [Candidatus Electrothrix sp. ATG1]